MIKSPLFRLARAVLGDRAGNMATLAALTVLPMVAVTGAGIDLGRAYSLRSKLQASLDEAVLAGARDGSSAWKTTAGAALTAAMTDAGQTTLSSSFSGPTSNAYTGTATATLQTAFVGLLGVSTFDIGATATAIYKPAGNVACIILVDKTASQPFLVNSGAKVTAPNCEIHVKSTANPAAIFNSGSAITTARICVAGSSIIDNGGTHPNLSKSCAAVDDPYAATWPTPSSSSCTTSNGNYNGGTVTLSPGTYCGWFNFNSAPTVKFNPGTYVIKNGGWNVNGGTWTGDGVTFYFADTSKIQFNAGVKTTLTAPTSGTYKDLLFGEAPGLSQSQFVFDTSAGHNLKGIMHLPSRQVTFNAGADVTSDQLILVFDTLILNSMTWTFAPFGGGSSGGGSGTAYLAK